MGNCTTLSDNVVDVGNNVDEEVIRKFQPFLVRFPRLFAEFRYQPPSTNKKPRKEIVYYISCTTGPKLRSISFQVSDCKKYVWKKIVNASLIIKMKNTIDVSNSLKWKAFFKIFRKAFTSDTLNISFPPPVKIKQKQVSICHLTMILSNIPVVKQTSLTLGLKQVENVESEISKCYVLPLFEFYHFYTEQSPDARIKEMGKQLEDLKVKRERMKKKQEKKLRKQQQREQAAMERVGGEGERRRVTSSPGSRKRGARGSLGKRERKLSLSQQRKRRGDRASREDFYRRSFDRRMAKPPEKIENPFSSAMSPENINMGIGDVTAFLTELLRRLSASGSSVLSEKERDGIMHVISTLKNNTIYQYKDNNKKMRLRQMHEDREIQDHGAYLMGAIDTEVVNRIKTKFSQRTSSPDLVNDADSPTVPAVPPSEGGGEEGKAGEEPPIEIVEADDGEALPEQKKQNSNMTTDLVGFKETVEGGNINRISTQEQIVKMFDQVDSWKFDVFKLHKLTEGQTLFITCYTLFNKYDFLRKFAIPEKILIQFLKEIEGGYHSNPYHNAMHAADVTQIIHYMILKGGIGEHTTDLDNLALLTASLIHDYDHPGLNNQYQKATGSYLAILYNDRSILENHHVAQSFELLRSKNFNIFNGLSRPDYKHVRKLIIELVIATDMENHKKYLDEFGLLLGVDNVLENKNAEGNLIIVLQMAIKIADVSNASRDLELYLQWAKRIETEFYDQGDKERSMHLTVSPFMDRNQPSISGLQKAFIGYLVLPMVSSFCELFEKMGFALDHIKRNLNYWKLFQTVDLENIEEFEELEKSDKLVEMIKAAEFKNKVNDRV